MVTNMMCNRTLAKILESHVRPLEQMSYVRWTVKTCLNYRVRPVRITYIDHNHNVKLAALIERAVFLFLIKIIAIGSHPLRFGLSH